MAANMARKLKSSSTGGQDEWSVREKLILASSVLRSGDQNWVSVSRTVKPIAESTFGAKSHPPDFFSQKSCAARYSEMLEKVATPKRKRTNEVGGTETPGEQIVRTLTFERIDELKKLIKADQMKYRKVKSEIDTILSGKWDDRLPMILDSLQNRPKPQMEPPTGYNPSQQRETMKPPQYPPPPSSSPSVVQQPLKSPVSPSPQKMKNLRVPKPTERFQKYQQQQQARHGHTASQNQQQQQQFKQQMSALEQLQKQKQLQKFQQQMQQQQMHQQQFQQQQQLQQHVETHKTLLPTETPSLPDHNLSPKQFFRSNGQQEMILHQQQQQLITSTVPGSFPNIPDKSHLTQLAGHNAVKKDVTAMEIDVSFDKQVKHKVSPSIKEAPSVHDGIVENNILVPTPLSGATSSGLLSTLLTAPVNEMKHVAESMNLSSLPDQEKNITPEQMSETSSLPFLDGGNLSSDAQKAKPTTPSASEVAPTLSKLLTTTASVNGKVQNSPEAPQTKRTPAHKIDEPWLPPTSSLESTTKSRKPSGEESLSEVLSDTKEPAAKEDFDKEFLDLPAVPPPKVLVVSDETKPKPEKRRPGRPRTRKPPKETEEDDVDESLKESLQPSEVKVEADAGVEEKIKKCEDDLKKEDKAELSVQSSFGSESVPDSPASQISQSGSDDLESLQAQKNWKKSIMLVWRAAANHKYANVFLHPVTDDEAPGYHNVIYRPMDLSTIKKNIESGAIRTTSGFQRDMMLMFQNALMYNSADHDVYRMAEEMREDVMEQIQSYIATQLMVQSDRESKMLRGHKTDVFHFSL